MPTEKTMLIIASKLKETVKEMDGDLRMSGELPEALSDKVHNLLEAAKVRCEANGRKTLKPEDL